MNTVLKRIEHNQGIAKQERARVNANSLRQNITQTKPAPLPTQSKVVPPKVTNKIVPLSQVSKPVSEVRFQPKDIKEKPKQVKQPKPGAAGPPAAAPEKEVPGIPVERARPGKTMEPAEAGGPPKSPGDRMMKTGEGRPKAPGTGHEPIKEQRRVTPPEPTAKPQLQGEPRPGRQQPQVQQEPKPQKQHPGVQQPEPRQKPQPKKADEQEQPQQQDDDKAKQKQKGHEQQQ